jgi:hypothetical protein
MNSDLLRQRRCGWLDLVAKYAIQVNGVTLDDDEGDVFRIRNFESL